MPWAVGTSPTWNRSVSLIRHHRLQTLALRSSIRWYLKARRSCDELVIILENVMDASQLDMEGGVQTTLLRRRH